MTPERKRELRDTLRAKFFGWRVPPVELPPDSVLDGVLLAAYEAGRDDEREASAYDIAEYEAKNNCGD